MQRTHSIFSYHNVLLTFWDIYVVIGTHWYTQNCLEPEASEMLDWPSLDGMVVMMWEDLGMQTMFLQNEVLLHWLMGFCCCLLAQSLHSGDSPPLWLITVWPRSSHHHTCMGVLSGSLYSLFDIASHCCAFLCWIISKTMSGVRNSRLSSDSFVMLGCMVFRPIINNPHSSSCLPGCQ